MKIASIPFMFLFVTLLTGCVTSHPQNADGFRAVVSGASLAKVDKYEVTEPLHEMASFFEKMSPKCLDVAIKAVSQSPTSYQVIVTDYNPTVIVGKDLAELHLQQHHKQGVMKITEEPEGGYYLMVFDAIKLDGGNPRIEYYGSSVGHETIIKAVKGWASGENVGCPDLTA